MAMYWAMALAVLIVTLAVACLFPGASNGASRALLDTIGGPGSEGGKFFSARGIAANHATGDFYVADGANNRIQQFTADGEFIRTWGLDVDKGGGVSFEICTVAAECKAGIQEGGAAGEVGGPFGLAIDQTNGFIYAVSNTNKRVDIFSSSGAFAGAFGWGVDTGAGKLELCTTASGCQSGLGGSGAGQLLNPLLGSSPAIDPTAPPGIVFVPDQANARVSKFATTIEGGELKSATFVKAFGWDVAPGAVDEEQEVRVRAASGQFKLTFNGDTTTDILFNASAAEVQTALNALPSISTGGGSVTVTGGPGDPSGSSPYAVRFSAGPLAGTNVPELTTSDGTTPLAGGTPNSGASVLLRAQGGATTELESCTTASGCKAGSTGGGFGQFAASGAPSSSAIDSTGAIYVISGPFGASGFENDCSLTAPCRLQKFNPATTTATNFGPVVGPGQITNTTALNAGEVAALDVAVDPTDDHVFVNKKTGATAYQVFEYDSGGTFLKSHPPGDLTSSGGFIFSHGLAVGMEERLYSGMDTNFLYLLGVVVDPHPTMGGVSDVGPTSATFKGTIEIPPPGAPTPAKYHFEYSTDQVEWTSAPPQDKSVGDGSPGTYPVSFKATGLEPNTDYFVRLVATTGNEPVISNVIEFTTGEAPPRVALLYTEGVTQTEALLSARLDPEGLESSYHFEWTTQSQWEAMGWNGAQRAPVTDAPLGDGNQPVIVQQSIAGLTAGTVYRFRAVAKSSAGETIEELVFETLNLCGYTGNRCLELVSPSDKGPVGAAGDTVALGQELRFQAAFDGSSIAYEVAYGLKDATAGNEVVYQADRGSLGWSTKQLSGPTILPSVDGLGSTPSKVLALSKDLSCGFLASTELLTPDAPKATRDIGHSILYRRNADGTYTLVTSVVPNEPYFPDPLGRYSIVGMNEEGPSDCGTAFFRSFLTYPGVPGAGAQRLYEWDEGQLDDVGVVPGAGGLEMAEVVPGEGSNFWRAVSGDASRIYLTAISKLGGDKGQQAVFMRERTKGTGELTSGSTTVGNVNVAAGEFNPGQEISGAGIPAGTTIVSVEGTTLELSQAAATSATKASLRAIRVIDVSQSQNPGIPNDSRSRYETASADGGVAFFTAKYGLTEEGTQPGATECVVSTDEKVLNAPGCALYRYSVDSGELAELSVTEDGIENAKGPSVAGVLGASDDGSRVYFAARGQLTAGEGATEGENLVEETYNVYLSEEGELSYVGLLGHSQFAVFRAFVGASRQFWSARVSPDGRYLLFASEAPFTELGSADEGTQREVYLYDAEAEGPAICVSCRKDDKASLAPEGFEPLVSGGADAANFLRPPATLAVSSEGNARAFFISYNPLATGAVPGQPNLFMWEGGQTTFLGTSAPSAVKRLQFAGSSATGDDVYFTTADRMSWQDKDSKLDVYDVRVGGGFAEPPTPTPCDPLAEGGCPGAPGAASAAPSPASATFTGPEMVEEAKKKKAKKKQSKKKKKKKQSKKKKKHQNNRESASGNSRRRRRGLKGEKLSLLKSLRLLALALACAALFVAISPTLASAAAPAWRILAATGPTNIAPEGEGVLAVYVTNVGGAPTVGPTTLKIGPLPAGVTTAGDAESTGNPEPWSCSPKGAGASTINCTLVETVGPLKTAEPVRLPLQVDSAAASASTTAVEVSGGGALTDPQQRNVYEAAITVSEEDAEPGIQALWAEAFDAEGQTSVRAGAHPNGAGTVFMVNTVRSPSGFIKPAGDPRDVIVDLPPGFIGNPTVTPRCPNELVGGCGLESFVGEAIPFVQTFGNGKTNSELRVSNDEPPPGYAAQFTFRVFDALAAAVASVRSDEDYGVRVTAPNIPTPYSIYGAIFMLEGNPPGAEGVPFLTNPTSCAEQAQRTPITKFQMNSWQVPSIFDLQTTTIAPVVECEGLEFEPDFGLSPSSNRVATGVATTAHLHLDQEGLLDAAKRATPHLKRSVVSLPEGVTLNPAAAAGLEACSTAQVGYMGGSFPEPNPMRFDMEPVSCPAASKIGTAQIQTPLLEDTLQGTVYLAAQNDNPFGSLLAMYLVVEDEKTGTVVKLPGEVQPNQQTGQLTAVFDHNPQVPFTDLTLNFRGGGPRSTLATPDVCATYTTQGEFTPWSAPESGPPAQTKDSFAISAGLPGKPCPTSKAARPFGPQAVAGTLGVQAGAHSPFVINIDRGDGEQEIKRISITLPPGLTGKLAGIPYCPEFAIAAAKGKAGKAEQAMASCPAASRIGSVSASAGVGDLPITVGGTAYLAGPYSGAPLSVVVITPAVAGPFDLGNVVIRTPLNVDLHTAQLRAVSDEVPHILQGLPLQLRSLSIRMDRPNFTLNPTSCKRMSIGVGITGAGGDPQNPADDTLVNREVPFQAGGCNALKFGPKLKLKFKGGTKRSQNPAIRAVLTQPGGQSNIARTVVILPRSAFIDQAHISNPCTRVQFAANACPPKSILGTAKAWSPLLDQPLQGNVYFRSNGGERELPDMVAVLRGQVDVELIGFIDAVPNKQGTSRVRNTFAIVPDAPVSRFELNLKGGKRGLVENSVNLCKVKKKRNRATVKMVAHNGRKRIIEPVIANDCKGKPKPGKGKGGKKGR